MRVPADTRIFLLSPARCDGKRAQALLNPRATFPLAVELRSRHGAPLGDVFSFLSGLYFRGKLAYAREFVRGRADSATASGSIRIITTNRGLVEPDTRVTPHDLNDFACVDLGEAGESFSRPLLRDARTLAAQAGSSALCVLLGSIATNKYVSPLLEVFGERLVFPREFIGRGDMSRGGLMLRCADSGQELEYVPVANAVRHGKRPPKLEPRKSRLTG